MKYITRQQMKELDRKAIEEYHIPALILMENAGRAVADEVLKMLDNPETSEVSILCGRGNNGGDGLVVARHLFNQGVKVKVFYLGNIKESLNKGEAGINLNIVLKMKIPLEEVTITRHNLKSIIYNLKSSLIIDAIFGIGLERPIEGQLKELIDRINTLQIPIVAVDMPSGLDADKGIPLGTAIRATKTVTFGMAKTGFVKESAKDYLGELIVVDISIPRTLV